ncbi:dTDP-4-dehydrorhamnose 3,5-epimerase [bacterium]|nr:dTDP-4-dehydrorhamnose 3,5-epimerase [bacterium]
MADTIGFIKTDLPEVIIIEPRVFRDARGFFLEIFNSNVYFDNAIKVNFVQDNHSRSSKDILRGLHYQLNHAQDKLIQVIRGKIFDVAVDIRVGSPNFGKWVGLELSEYNHRQLFVPKGFAHGFCVLSSSADVIYKCSDYYAPNDEFGILWSCPEISIDWPSAAPVLSKKDKLYTKLSGVKKEHLPVYAR